VASPQEPDPGPELSADVPRSSFFLQGVLFELFGACLVLLTSGYSAHGWLPAMDIRYRLGRGIVPRCLLLALWRQGS
jgi:hypothetical protein